MHSSTLLKTALAAAIALIGQTHAQVTTSCDPTKGICPNDKGLAAPTYAIDFASVKTLPSEWTLADSENVTLGPQGAEFAFEKRYDSPTMWTDFKFFFGRVEFVVKAAQGTGIVSSMVLLSGDLDEIDWEFLGGATSTVQTNYFGKGYTGTYNRSTTSAVTSPQTTFHTYAIDWSPTALIWSIDGAAVRTLKAADADGNGSQYPQTPMKVSLSLWDAGDPDAATQGWGGGVTPVPPPEPYVMYVKSVKIWNTNPAQQYKYTDRSGSYNSIKLIQEPIVSSSSSQISSQSTKTLSLGSISAPSSTVSAGGSWSSGVLPSGVLPSGALPSGSYSTGNQSYVWNDPAHHTASSSDDHGSDSSSGCSTSEASSLNWASTSGQSDSIAQAYTSTIDDTITLPSTNCSCTLKNGTTTITASPTVWVTPTNVGLWNTSSGTPAWTSASWWPTAAVSSAAASSAIRSPAYNVYGNSVSWTTSWGTSTSVLTSTTSCSETQIAAENRHVSVATSTPIAVSSIVSSPTPDASSWSIPSSIPGNNLHATDSYPPYPSDTAIPASQWSSSLYSSWSSSSAQPSVQTQPARIPSSSASASDNAWASTNTWVNSYASSASASASSELTTISSLTSRSTSTSTRVLSILSSVPTDITISNTVTQGVGYWNCSTIASGDDQVPTQAASTSFYLPPLYPTTNPSAPLLNPPLVSGSGAWVNGTIPFTGAAYKDSISLKTIFPPVITITGVVFLFW
ncbi:MAG: hypothetical protein Q9194_006948 [Teloschistes cf. exilis]